MDVSIAAAEVVIVESVVGVAPSAEVATEVDIVAVVTATDMVGTGSVADVVAVALPLPSSRVCPPEMTSGPGS